MSPVYDHVSHVEAPWAQAVLDFVGRIGSFAIGLRNYDTNGICVEQSCSLRPRFPITRFEVCDSQYPLSEKSVPYIYSVNVFQNLERQLREALSPRSL